MTTATSLLMKDFTPPEPAANAQAPTPSGPHALHSEVPGPMFPLMPVADVLITERRVCKACGNVSHTQCDRVHRLLSSCAGDPFKRVLRPRKPEDPPTDRKVEHIITIPTEHCAACWRPTHLWGEVWNIQPPAPPRRSMTVMAEAFGRAKEKAARLPRDAKIKSMTAEEAAEYL